MQAFEAAVELELERALVARNHIEQIELGEAGQGQMYFALTFSVFGGGELPFEFGDVAAGVCEGRAVVRGYVVEAESGLVQLVAKEDGGTGVIVGRRWVGGAFGVVALDRFVLATEDATRAPGRIDDGTHVEGFGEADRLQIIGEGGEHLVVFLLGLTFVGGDVAGEDAVGDGIATGASLAGGGDGAGGLLGVGAVGGVHAI